MRSENLVDRERHRILLEHFFEVCTDFIVVYPEGETEEDYIKHNPLIFWKREFMALPNIYTTVYEGMANAVEIHGKLTEEARHIMFSALESDLIWQYSLYKNGVKLFEVYDFHDGLVYE